MTKGGEAKRKGTGKRGKFLGSRRFLLSASLLSVLVVSAFAIPILSSFSYDKVEVRSQLSPPSLTHPMGTDSKGRDLLVRVFSGARLSFLVAAVATLISMGVGVIYGATAGLRGGKIDELMMRFVDVLFSVPYLFLVILITVILGKSLLVIVFALGAFQWLTMARIVRGQVLSLKKNEFVTAARALGTSWLSILRRHIVPNLAGIVIVYLTLTVPRVMLQEAFLSFLGLGVPPPQASLGTLAAEGYAAINPLNICWWLVLFPGGILSAALFSLNFLGEDLAQALQPVRKRG